jgi:hypothetical protein
MVGVYILYCSIFVLSILASANAESTPAALFNSHLFRRQTETTDPCDCSCAAIKNDLSTCQNSTDPFCGCSAWINHGAQCASCTSVFKNSSNEDPTTVQLIRAFCLCPDSCKTVANESFFKCGLFPGQCICPVLANDGDKCNECIKQKDPWAGLLLDQFIGTCTGFEKNATSIESDIPLYPYAC